MFRDNDIIFLLGAGCSVDAGIPSTTEMIADIEKKIQLESKWKKYKDLYNLTKSSIFYSRGIRGIYTRSLNIEEVVNILNELDKQDEIPLLPFIGTWSPKLVSIAGQNFKNIKDFRDMIVEQLKKWIGLNSYNKSKYYKGFFDFQRDFGFPLRIFSLNYDRCLEEIAEEQQIIERGFDPNEHYWDWRRFDTNPGEAKIFLYKLHGSIDWKRDKKYGNVLKEIDENFDDPELIFGTNYKLQYIDPYLFYIYEFRKWSLECKYIIVIGYGFNDEHINGILKQAVENNSKRMVLVVSKSKKDDILKTLSLSKKENQIITPEESLNAKQFLENLSMKKLSSMIGITTDTDEEIEEFSGEEKDDS